MNFDPSALARETIDARVREANHLRLVRELQRREPALTAPAAVQPPLRHSRLWRLVHFRQAYS